MFSNLIPHGASLIRLMLLCLAPIVFADAAWAHTVTQNHKLDWRTPAERTNYRETPRYDATLEFVRRLAAAAPQVIRATSFGKSPEARDLPLVIAAAKGEFTPQQARASNKPIILVQACIHAGEADGKDAGLALLRDIAIDEEQRAEILSHVILLFIPIYNVDGHERWSAYNRINQNGPVAMGWRANATRLNLNRDYMKADAPETRAWLALWNAWSPDLFIDLHTTDGADFQPDVTYQYEARANVQTSVATWMRTAMENRIRPATERLEHTLSPYITFRDNRDPAQGVEAFISTPRFATAYVPIARNRPALLIETHALKDNRTRIRASYDLLRATLDEVNRDGEGLRRVVREADETVVREGKTYDANRRLALSLELTDKAEDFLLKGVKFRRELSEVSGAVRVVFEGSPQNYNVPLFTDARVNAEVSLPLYYVVPPAWTEIIERLELHGIRFTKLSNALTTEVESYRFRDVKFAANSFEGRVPVSYKVELVRLRRTLPPGSIIISLAQPAARVVVQMLEPQAPDSLAAWGFFNSVFEQKEFGEDYVLERIAREMLARDADLRREFEERVRNDSRFAADSRARLRFFYDRSPYADNELNLYPVARIVHAIQ